MKNHIADVSQRKAAIVAGLGLLLMTVLAIFANFYVVEGLVVPGDATATATNIAENEPLFRAGICCLIVVAALDVVVAWALYAFAKQVNKGLSLLMAWFRLVYAALLGVAVANLLGVLLLLGGASYLTAFDTGQFHAQVALLVSAFGHVWDIGYVFFGLHLLLLGYLVFKLNYSGYIPKILGVLIVIASLGYLVDSFGKFLTASYDANIGVFTFFGELLLMLWLLWGGARGFGRKLEEQN
jgi:hypothetical protein